MNKLRVSTYDELLGSFGSGRKHLLLGNGFSIACDKRFAYPSLFNFACSHGLSTRAQKIFDRLGTNNFEGVLRLLEDSLWIVQHYGVTDNAIISAMEDDLQVVKQSLVDAIAETHLEHTNEVEESRKQNCVKFLMPFHNVFTTNYDLLLYWVAMQGRIELQEQDGFRPSLEDPDAEYLVFREHVGGNRGMFFLHGALHLYATEGEIRKHSWIRSQKRLTVLIREGLSGGQYPLFVAEGLPERKRQQIQQNGYLSYCLGKLERIEKTLFVYGLSLSDNDRHLAHTIADNDKIEHLCIGLYGEPDSTVNQAIRQAADTIVRRRKEWQSRFRNYKDLSIDYFDSATARVWD